MTMADAEQEALEKEQSARVSALEAELASRASANEQLKRALARAVHAGSGSGGSGGAGMMSAEERESLLSLALSGGDEKRAALLLQPLERGGAGTAGPAGAGQRVASSRELLTSLEDSKRKLKDIEARARAGLVALCVFAVYRPIRFLR